MSDFDQSQYRRLKTRLTTKKNKFDAALRSARGGRMEDSHDALITVSRALIEEVDSANAYFDKTGYPDAWADWERAKMDAEMHLRRMGVKP